MPRRLLLAAAVALSVAATATPSSAGSAKLYLNELSTACGDGTQNVITASPDDEGACIYVPRAIVDGTGYQTTNEAFVSIKKLKAFRVDSGKKLTGTFALFGGSGLRSLNGGALVTADFTIKIAKKTVGTVRVEGVATPTTLATKSFTLSLPKSLNRVLTNSVSVSVNWITCVGLCGVEVSGASFLTVPTR